MVNVRGEVASQRAVVVAVQRISEQIQNVVFKRQLIGAIQQGLVAES